MTLRLAFASLLVLTVAAPLGSVAFSTSGASEVHDGIARNVLAASASRR